MSYWVDDTGERHEVSGEGPDPFTLHFNRPAYLHGKPLHNACLVHDSRGTFHYNEKGMHCEDGPAAHYHDGDIEYWVNGKIPLSILDILIIRGEIDHELFPSAERINVQYWGQHFAYRLDQNDLPLAILKYS